MNKSCTNFGFAILLSLCLLLTACKPTTPTLPAPSPTTISPQPAATTETTIVETQEPPETALIQEPISPEILLDPAITQDEDSLLVCSYLYEGLVELDENGAIEPALAINWTLSGDELDYIFQLRRDVFFHDGSPFTADAVIANFNRWFDPQSPLRGTSSYDSWEEYFLGFKGEKDAEGKATSYFDGIEKINDLSVLIHLNRPVSDLLSYLTLTQFSIVNPAVLETEGEKYGTQEGSVSGTGSYMLTAWTEESLELTPNPQYWGATTTSILEFPFR
ncbi:MAG: ABC transporter substrate-binding protein [Chloroflexota bacterium]